METLSSRIPQLASCNSAQLCPLDSIVSLYLVVIYYCFCAAWSTHAPTRSDETRARVSRPSCPYHELQQPSEGPVQINRMRSTQVTKGRRPLNPPFSCFRSLSRCLSPLSFSLDRLFLPRVSLIRFIVVKFGVF